MYLLDTDLCSFAAQPTHTRLRERLLEIPSEQLAISAVTYAEILFGLEDKRVGVRRIAAVEEVLRSVQILDWPRSAAPIYGHFRAQLKRSGQPTGDMDLLIASHAIAIDATLVTNNVRHFGRIGVPLRVENWLK